MTDDLDARDGTAQDGPERATLSWILELRRRLAELDRRSLAELDLEAGGQSEEPDARGQPEEEEKVIGALFVGLFVDQGQLRIALIERPSVAVAPGPPAAEVALYAEVARWADLPSRTAPTNAPAWAVAARAARDLLGVAPGAILEIGTLAPLVDPARPDDEGVIVPCVGAIPWPIPELEGSEPRNVFPLTVLAYSGPKSVHQETIDVGGVERRVVAYEVQGRRLSGLTVAVLDDLVSRLGLGN